MTPSLRSHPNHPQQPVSPPYTRNVRGNGYGSGHWLRHSFAGSPLLQTESGSLSFGTTSPPRAAPHPVSRRRSCLWLLSRCSSRDDSDFHWLISYMCIRTNAPAGALRYWDLGSQRSLPIKPTPRRGIPRITILTLKKDAPSRPCKSCSLRREAGGCKRSQRPPA